MRLAILLTFSLILNVVSGATLLADVSPCFQPFGVIAARVKKISPGHHISYLDASGRAVEARVISVDKNGVGILLRGDDPTRGYTRVATDELQRIKDSSDPSKVFVPKRRGKVAEELDAAARMFFQPIDPVQDFTADQFLKQKRAQLAEILEMNVKVREIDATDALTEWGTPAQRNAAKFVGTMRQVIELPLQKAKPGPDAIALQHPDMAEYMRELEREGYKLVVDLSLPFTGAGAYFNDIEKIVAIRPTSPWSHFVHEFEHFKVDQFLTKRAAFVSQISAGSAEQVLPKEIAAILDPARIKRLNQLEQRGLPENGLHETMAVDAELRLRGLRGFLSASAAHSRSYALVSQTASLLAEEHRTRQQNVEIAKSVGKGLANWAGTFAVRHPIVAAGAGYGGYYAVTSLLVSEDRGEMYVQSSDGKWTVYRTLESNR